MILPKSFILIGIFLILVTGIVFWQQFLKEKPSLSEKTVLFLCVHNTFRSQVAEAYFEKFAKEKKLNWQATSAGFLEADKINEKAISLMQEERIDISDKKPKLMTDEMITEAGKIVVVCKECEEQGLCLNLPKEKDVDYWRLENPANLEIEKGREIRDLIKEKVLNLIENLESGAIVLKQGLHWHAELSIKILGEYQETPANIGIGINERPIHTHRSDGVIHMEFTGLVKKEDLRLGQFFEIWGKNFNKDCIFDKCSGPEGKLKMLVNGKENFEFENYIMRDKDKIEIIFE